MIEVSTVSDGTLTQLFAPWDSPSDPGPPKIIDPTPLSTQVRTVEHIPTYAPQRAHVVNADLDNRLDQRTLRLELELVRKERDELRRVVRGLQDDLLVNERRLEHASRTIQHQHDQLDATIAR